jgi:ribokinase
MILVVGSANLDFVVRSTHIPAPGETVLGREFNTFPGGKGANQAIACARAGGANTSMQLALGNDAFAVPLEQSLVSAGVKLHIKRVSNTPSGAAFICVSDEGENAITVAPGANNELHPNDLLALTGFTHLLLQLETPLATVIAAAQAAHEQGVQVVLNAAPAQALPEKLLNLIDILIVNQGELAAIANHKGTVQECLERVTVPCVVVTLGSQGSIARFKGQIITHPAFSVKVVDSTAAGDTFCGVLVAALSNSQDFPSALRMAGAAGALACTKLGAQSSIPNKNEVSIFLQNH